jgi:hypothetical protein
MKKPKLVAEAARVELAYSFRLQANAGRHGCALEVWNIDKYEKKV